ncbi:MAG: NAD(P)H-dependent oxidoreductase [Clostridiaceae bacterium]|nr:NAD(P)H-dependent oxidoreductase [Clostridiaceae bacterium]
MNLLFINGSPNKDGNTVRLAKALIDGKDYNTIHLVDCKLYSYGQEYEDDQFGEILSKMKASDTIVIGSPVYWHNLSGAVRNLIDRFYGPVSQGELRGKRLFVLFQGASPEKWMLESGEYTMKRFAGLYGMEYMGMATSISEAKELSKKV